MILTPTQKKKALSTTCGIKTAMKLLLALVLAETGVYGDMLTGGTTEDPLQKLKMMSAKGTGTAGALCDTKGHSNIRAKQTCFNTTTTPDQVVEELPNLLNSQIERLLTSNAGGRIASFRGDVHLTTFDGLDFDCQAAGEFTLLESVQSRGFKIQGRFSRVPMTKTMCRQVSVATGVAVAVPNLPVVELSIANTTSTDLIGGCPVRFFVNGVQRSISSGSGNTGFKIRKYLSQSLVKWSYVNSNMTISILVSNSTKFGCYFSAGYFYLPPCYRSNETLRGLLGTPNNNQADDWTGPQGSALAIPASDLSRRLRASYRYSVLNWCIRNATASKFRHGRGSPSFASVNQCSAPYRAQLMGLLANASLNVKRRCQNDTACQIDAVCGSLADGTSTLTAGRLIHQKQSQLPINTMGCGTSPLPSTKLRSEFWVAELQQFDSCSGNFSLAIVNPRDNPKATVSIKKGNATRIVEVAPNSLQLVSYACQAYTGSEEDVSIDALSAFHVTSSQPISLYAFTSTNPDFLFEGATSVLPVEALGKKYHFLGPDSGFLGLNPKYMMGVVAASVGITRIKVFDGGITRVSETLRQGQLLRYGGRNPTGFTVEADKPVALFSGVNGIDYMQILPEAILGTSYFSCSKSDSFVSTKVMATQDNTTVQFGDDNEVETLDRGQLTYRDESKVSVNADKPIAVVQVRGFNPGHAVIGVPPTERFLSRYDFVTPNIVDAETGSRIDSYIDLAVPEMHELILDGQKLTKKSCQDLEDDAGQYGGLTYCCFEMKVSAGIHTIQSSTNTPFGLLVGTSGGYGYSGGFGLNQTNP